MSKFKVLVPDNPKTRELDIEADGINNRISDRIILTKHDPDDATNHIIVASFPGSCSAYMVE